MAKAKALFFGSIGTLADTSELQRRAYNRAFAEAGLDWIWDRGTYFRLLREPGGRARIAAHAETVGDAVDAASLHGSKVRHFADLASRTGIAPRPGVVDMLQSARARGMNTALCSTTVPDQVEAVTEGLSRAVRSVPFDWIADGTCAARPKPAPDIFNAALGRFDLDPSGVVVVEDTPECAEAALAAGCHVVAFPGEAAADRDFPPGILVVDRLQPRLLDMATTAFGMAAA